MRTYVVVLRVALPVEAFDRHHATARAESTILGGLVGHVGASAAATRVVPLLDDEPPAGKCRVLVEGPAT